MSLLNETVVRIVWVESIPCHDLYFVIWILDC